MSESRTVGIIGVGLLGSAIAERLLKFSFEVIGFDTQHEQCRALEAQGGRCASSSQEVAKAVRRLIFCLPDSDIAARVLDELRPTLNSEHLIIDCTTGDPPQMEDNGHQLADAGVGYLDATVGGSSNQVRRRESIVMVGGSEAHYSAAQDLFDTFAPRVFHVGPCGAGARMKLAVNLVLGLNRAALAEGLSFASKIGLDPTLTLEIFRAGPAWSRAMDVKGERMLQQNFEPEARLSQHLKDVRLILAAGAEHDARLPLSELHRSLLEQLERAGYGAADNSAIIKAFGG